MNQKGEAMTEPISVPRATADFSALVVTICGEFCRASIWSTPKNPGNHAKQIRRIVDNCIMQKHKDIGEE